MLFIYMIKRVFTRHYFINILDKSQTIILLSTMYVHS